MANVSRTRRAGQSRCGQQARHLVSTVDPLVPLDIINARSLSRVIIENTRDQISSLGGDLCVVWEAVLVTSDSLIGCLNVVSFKWRLSNDQGVNNNSQRPDVHLVGMALFALKNFWRDIIGSTANCPFTLSVELKLSGQTKITHLDLHLVVKEQVTEL